MLRAIRTAQAEILYQNVSPLDHLPPQALGKLTLSAAQVHAYNTRCNTSLAQPPKKASAPSSSQHMQESSDLMRDDTCSLDALGSFVEYVPLQRCCIENLIPASPGLSYQPQLVSFPFGV